MIGNDIVDLAYAAEHHHWRRPGYLAKIFTLEERAQIAAADDPDRLVWTLWSAKESAYKVSIQQGEPRTYAPQQWRAVQLGSSAAATIHYRLSCGERQYQVRVWQYPELVHSIARPWGEDQGKLRTRQVVLPGADQGAQSAYLKRVFCQDYDQQSGEVRSPYEWRKTTAGVPFLTGAGKPLELPLSLSHHGRFGAFAYVLKSAWEEAGDRTV